MDSSFPGAFTPAAIARRRREVGKIMLEGVAKMKGRDGINSSMCDLTSRRCSKKID